MSNDNSTSFSGNIPEYYDNALVPIIFVDFAAEMARRLAALKPTHVLETAAGTGVVTRAMRDALPASIPMTVTDLAAAMLDIARKRFRPGEALTFQPADGTALPFSDNSFDAVVCQFGVMFYPDKDKGYREVLRVLQPGGTYLFSVWDSHAHNSYGRIAYETVAAFFPKDPPQFQKIPFSYPFEAIKDSLTAAGFADINASVIRLQKAVPDFRHFARGFIYGTPVIDQVKARGGVDPEALVAKLTEAYHREFGPDGRSIPLQTLFFSAQKPA
ncbi:MAG: methyltransferase domain-containing protein [Bauldia sp.]